MQCHWIVISEKIIKRNVFNKRSALYNIKVLIIKAQIVKKSKKTDCNKEELIIKENNCASADARNIFCKQSF